MRILPLDTVLQFLSVAAGHAKLVVPIALLGIALLAPDGASAARTIDVDVPDAEIEVVAEPSANGDASLTFNLHACPMGYDTSNPDMYQVAEDCNLPAPATTFHVYEPDGPGQTATFDWIYTWPAVHFGKIAVRQATLDGYKPSFAFCKTDEQQGFFLANPGSREVVLEIAPNSIAYCDWFVTPRWKPTVPDVVAIDDLAVLDESDPVTPPVVDDHDTITVSAEVADIAVVDEAEATPEIEPGGTVTAGGDGEEEIQIVKRQD